MPVAMKQLSMKHKQWYLGKLFNFIYAKVSAKCCRFIFYFHFLFFFRFFYSHFNNPQSGICMQNKNPLITIVMIFEFELMASILSYLYHNRNIFNRHFAANLINENENVEIFSKIYFKIFLIYQLDILKYVYRMVFI